MDMNQLLTILPNNVRHRVEPYFDAVEVLTAVKDPRVMASLGPSGVRGLLLQRFAGGVGGCGFRAHGGGLKAAGFGRREGPADLQPNVKNVAYVPTEP